MNAERILKTGNFCMDGMSKTTMGWNYFEKFLGFEQILVKKSGYLHIFYWNNFIPLIL